MKCGVHCISDILQLFVLMSAPQNECIPSYGEINPGDRRFLEMRRFISNVKLVCLSGKTLNRALACLVDCVTA